MCSWISVCCVNASVSSHCQAIQLTQCFTQSRSHVSDICLQWQCKLLLVCRASFILHFCHNQKEVTLHCGHMSFCLLLLVCHWAITPACSNCKNYEKTTNIFKAVYPKDWENNHFFNNPFMFHYHCLSHSLNLSLSSGGVLGNYRLLTFHISFISPLLIISISRHKTFILHLSSFIFLFIYCLIKVAWVLNCYMKYILQPG